MEPRGSRSLQIEQNSESRTQFTRVSALFLSTELFDAYIVKESPSFHKVGTLLRLRTTFLSRFEYYIINRNMSERRLWLECLNSVPVV